MAATPHYSLWLCPEEGSWSFNNLESIIIKYAGQIGAPAFLPHVTLYSPLHATDDQSCIEQTQTFVEMLCRRQCTGVRLAISHVEGGASFFQCVYGHIGMGPHRPSSVYDDWHVVDVHREAAVLWGDLPFTKTYMPHVSFVYGDLDDVVKASLVQQVQADLARLPHALSFRATCIRVVDTRGTPEQWRYLASFPLSAKD